MDESAAFSLVKKYLVEQFEVQEEKITMDAQLFDELELDSIDALDMIGLMEKEFSVEIGEESLKDIRSVRELVAFIKETIPG